MYVSVPFRSSTFLSDVKVDLVNAKAVAYFKMVPFMDIAMYPKELL
jgi:hypothetical protein